MQEADCLVFVEVRVRSARSWSDAAESVDGKKQDKLIRAASLFECRYPGLTEMPMRFDVVAIERKAAGETRVNWIRDAFRPGD